MFLAYHYKLWSFLSPLVNEMMNTNGSQLAIYAPYIDCLGPFHIRTRQGKQIVITEVHKSAIFIFSLRKRSELFLVKTSTGQDLNAAKTE